MDLRSRGEKGRRSFADTLLLIYICLIGMHFSLQTAVAEEYPSFLQNTGETADSISSEQEADNKRSSSFFALRGKKSDLDSPETPFRYPLVSNQQLEDKRSQFYPLRGKKIPAELKRASYFMPMRGRKDDQDWSEEDSLEKRMSSFMPMRGRKDGEEDSLDKRMSSFMPMRGRKDDDDSIDAEDSMEKRMSSFMPMRGRKDDLDSLEKRMSSFMPMRGKKKSGPMTDGYIHFGKSGMYTTEIMNLPSSSSSNSGQLAFLPGSKSGESAPSIKNSTGPQGHSIQKRSESFLSMEGDRSLSNIHDELLDGRGIATSLLEKRRSSFMPMRGRKNSFESFLFDHADKSIGEKYMPMSEIRNLQINPETESYDGFEKKASSFMPMRGRRTYDQWYPNKYISPEEKKRRSQFMPMRGRRNNIENSLSDLNLLSSDSFTDDQSKRGSSFMAMRGRRFNENLSEMKSSSSELNKFPFGNGISSDLNLTEENTADFADDDKRASSFLPMRGRRGAFYHAYPHYVPSGIGSSLMTRHYGSGKMYPISSTWSRAIKSRKFDWDSVKRAFHATRGKRWSSSVPMDMEEDSNNFRQVPRQDIHETTRNPGAFRSLENELGTLHQWPTPGAASFEQDHEGKDCRCKRSILRPRISVKSLRQYIALKRPMSFFATRGKRMDSSAVESKIP